MTTKRTWRPKQVNLIDPVPDYANYQSFQKVINSNNGQINEELLELHIEEMMENTRYNWEEIPVDFSLVKPGDRIRYTTLNQNGEYLFRTGGWITSVAENGEYLAYMAHSKSSWCVQAEDCQRLFVIKSLAKKKASDTIKFKRPGEETDNNIYLTKNGKQIRVGSFRDKWTMERFTSSDKYKKALAGHKWEFKKDEE
jgi:hypothetical protein